MNRSAQQHFTPAEDSAARASFLPLRLEEELVKKRHRSSCLDHYHAFETKTFSAYILDSVLQRALTLARSAVPNEFIGLLAGTVYRDAQGEFILIQGIVPDTAAEAGPGRVTTTSDSEFTLRQHVSTFYPDCVPVGWCHSHVGIGAFFSGVDRETQATWPRSYHVGVVVDAIKEEVAVFRGPEAEPLLRTEQLVQAKSGEQVAAESSPPVLSSTDYHAMLSPPGWRKAMKVLMHPLDPIRLVVYLLATQVLLLSAVLLLGLAITAWLGMYS